MGKTEMNNMIYSKVFQSQRKQMFDHHIKKL